MKNDTSAVFANSNSFLFGSSKFCTTKHVGANIPRDKNPSYYIAHPNENDQGDPAITTPQPKLAVGALAAHNQDEKPSPCYGERNLLASVLLAAIYDYARYGEGLDKSPDARDAKGWLFYSCFDNRSDMLTARFCCQAVGLEIKTLRQYLESDRGKRYLKHIAHSNKFGTTRK